ncbi:hypothetical protein [Jatrophihabitans sp.]|uniref:hypothetical protein n=1 Tax=Jatrophihabitans sp. TaxID=1932789 RepID=UPI002C97D4C0|nr:hypothetical protein [Jatrophihabitans sp.]
MRQNTAGQGNPESPEPDAALDARLADWGRLARSAVADQPVPELPAVPPRRPAPLGWQLAAGVLTVVLAAAIAVGLPRVLDKDRRPPAPHGPAGNGISTAPVGPDLQVVTFHGLSITVPASWPVTGYGCSLTSSVVELPVGAPLCLRPAHPGFTIVQFSSVSEPMSPDKVTSTRSTTISGLAATRLEGSAYLGRPAFAYVVPELHASVLVMPASGQTGQDLADSLRVDTADAHGCTSTVTDVAGMPGSATSSRAGMAEALIPGEPVSASVCRYSVGLLEQGRELSGPALRSFTDTVNALPPGLSRATQLGLIKCREPDSVGSFDRELRPDSEAYRIEVRYSDGPPVVLIARLGQCGDLGISNGARTGQRTDDLMMLLIHTAGSGGGIPGAVRPAS